MSMTKVEAVSQWRRHIKTDFSEEEQQDRPLMSESWSMFIDGLRKDGQITERQYHEWVPPIETRPKKQF